jgi:hypothetical protein
MDDDLFLPVEDILRCPAPTRGRQEIGRSREMRPIYGFGAGTGPIAISLIAGCHADEPVGPATLTSLLGFLATRGPGSRWLGDFSWTIVPHANPDGRYRNRFWARRKVAVVDQRGAPDVGFDLGPYLDHVCRELPGDDVEFGFPRDSTDHDARPENLAISDFLSHRGPFDLHGSLHGMGLAPGPWFLIEESWSRRTETMRERLRNAVVDMGYHVYDPDRRGDKGFTRIDEGFTTRPDSREMKRHFESSGAYEIAAKFRPSSMELVRRLGEDPFTFVSEMPLFLTMTRQSGTHTLTDLRELRQRLEAGRRDGLSSGDLEQREQIRPMPLRDQQRLQLRFLGEAIGAVIEQ